MDGLNPPPDQGVGDPASWTDLHQAPPLEAYSRVTNPGRFQPLHTLALELIERLEADYEVTRTNVFAPTPGWRFDPARSPVTLTPLRPVEAPIAIAFTTFPSLLVRCGRWFVDGFPSCGCDACADTAAGESERLNRLLGDVVAGRFREELVIPLFGRTRLRWAFGDASRAHRGESYGAFTRKEARMLRDAPPGQVPWQPWSRRTDVAG